jgi:hypothetical protein
MYYHSVELHITNDENWLAQYKARQTGLTLVDTDVTYKGMVRSDISEPALIFFFTARVHTTKSTVKILAAKTHCKYFLKISEVTHIFCTRTACARGLHNPS